MTGQKVITIDLKAYSWDWKEQPDFSVINDMINDFRVKPFIYEIEDNSDQHGILITNLEGLDKRTALKYFIEALDERE